MKSFLSYTVTMMMMMMMMVMVMMMVMMMMMISRASVNAFSPPSSSFSFVSRAAFSKYPQTAVFSSAPSDVDSNVSKEALLYTARRLKQEYGLLLFEKDAKEELKRAVEDLESNRRDSTSQTLNRYKDTFLGDWTLLCSTSSNVQGVDTKKVPLFDLEPIRKIRELIKDNANKYLTVTQIIKSTLNDGRIDRVDHVLEYDPPAKLQELIDGLPQPLRDLNINPLDVTTSKVVLIHKASVESENPLRTKLALQSIVLNVAGKSTNLDPNGKDVLGLNLPLGEFLNAGDFETTYMDDTVRISRGKLGFVDQLRVFVRTSRQQQREAWDDVLEGPPVGRGVQAEEDVDDVVDPEFAESAQEDNSDVTDMNDGAANGAVNPHEPRDSEEANSI